MCDRLCLHFSRTCLLLKNPVLRLQGIWDMGQERPIELSYRDDAGKQVPKCPCFKMLAIVRRSFQGGDQGLITAPSLLQSKACSPVVNMRKAREMFLLIGPLFTLSFPGVHLAHCSGFCAPGLEPEHFNGPQSKACSCRLASRCVPVTPQSTPPHTHTFGFLGISHIISSFFEILYHCFDFIENFTGV